mgnify:FL=1
MEPSQARSVIAEILKESKRMPSHWYAVKFEENDYGSSLSQLLGLSSESEFHAVMDQARFTRIHGTCRVFSPTQIGSFLSGYPDLQAIEMVQTLYRGWEAMSGFSHRRTFVG